MPFFILKRLYLQSKHFIMTINVNLNITFDKVIKILFSSFNKKLDKIMSTLTEFQDKLAAIAANQEAQSASIAEIQSDIAELKTLIENGGMSAADEATALGLIDSILNKSNEITASLQATDELVPEPAPEPDPEG